MADFTSSPLAGGNQAQYGMQTAAAPKSNQLVNLTNIAGALVSLALVAGVGIWGYKLLVRDVTGIPVVRAASGEMRIRPEEPGGERASHQGLSVNAVAAEGTAAKPADKLILAPRPIDLTEEDRVVPVAMVADVPQQETTAVLPSDSALKADDVTAALQAGNVDDLVAKLTAGVSPMADSDQTEQDIVATVTETVVAEVNAAERQVAALQSEPGVRQSVRPKKRPAVRAVVTAAAQTVETAPAAEEVDPDSLPAGTRLAQLGAFDSPEVAREQWNMLQARFDTYLVGKKRVVQEASAGGSTFYRLRAMGFDDLSDAKRFCAVLAADSANCIPVIRR